MATKMRHPDGVLLPVSGGISSLVTYAANESSPLPDNPLHLEARISFTAAVITADCRQPDKADK
jgi:hypothetical protein